MSPTRTLAALAIAATCLASACSSSDTAAPTPVPTSAPAPTTVPTTAPTTVPTTEPTPTTDTVAAIDFDNPGLDVNLDVIADLIGEGVEGDPEWIDVMANLLARDWLLGRYPSDVDPQSVYSQSWIDEVVANNTALFVDNDLERRSKPPRLLSVNEVREIGGLTELRVRIFREPTVVISAIDGSVVNPFLGGTGSEGNTGLFKLGPPEDGSEGWRIYRIDQIDNPSDEDDG